MGRLCRPQSALFFDRGEKPGFDVLLDHFGDQPWALHRNVVDAIFQPYRFAQRQEFGGSCQRACSPVSALGAGGIILLAGRHYQHRTLDLRIENRRMVIVPATVCVIF